MRLRFLATPLILLAASLGTVARSVAATENPQPAVPPERAAPGTPAQNGAPPQGAVQPPPVEAAAPQTQAPQGAAPQVPPPGSEAPPAFIPPPASSASRPGPNVIQDLGSISKAELMQIRDPFKRMVTPKLAEAPRTDLEAFPVDQFKLVGVLKGLDRPRAMLSGPNSRTYFVSEGQRIGNRKGIIRRITETALVVREKFTNVIGKEENLDLELKLAGEAKTSGPTAGTAW